VPSVTGIQCAGTDKISFVAGGLGVALLPEQIKRVPHGGVIFRPLRRRLTVQSWVGNQIQRHFMGVLLNSFSSSRCRIFLTRLVRWRASVLDVIKHAPANKTQ